ncbi:MAG TPA: hypothetical protein PKJ51_03545 [Methanothrix sp.]|nr:hypothetical protein [Methanothrix sp.]
MIISVLPSRASCMGPSIREAVQMGRSPMAFWGASDVRRWDDGGPDLAEGWGVTIGDEEKSGDHERRRKER